MGKETLGRKARVLTRRGGEKGRRKWDSSKEIEPGGL